MARHEQRQGFWYPKDINDRLRVVEMCVQQIAIFEGQLNYYDPDGTLRTTIEQWRQRQVKLLSMNMEARAQWKLFFDKTWWVPLWERVRAKLDWLMLPEKPWNST